MKSIHKNGNIEISLNKIEFKIKAKKKADQRIKDEEQYLLSKQIRRNVIKPLCKNYELALVIHENYDEAAFVCKKTKEIYCGDAWMSEGNFKRVKNKKQQEAMIRCWALIGVNNIDGLVAKKQYRDILRFNNDLDRETLIIVNQYLSRRAN